MSNLQFIYLNTIVESLGEVIFRLNKIRMLCELLPNLGAASMALQQPKHAQYCKVRSFQGFIFVIFQND